jgi:hypothetical protein
LQIGKISSETAFIKAISGSMDGSTDQTLLVDALKGLELLSLVRVRVLRFASALMETVGVIRGGIIGEIWVGLLVFFVDLRGLETGGVVGKHVLRGEQ